MNYTEYFDINLYFIYQSIEVISHFEARKTSAMFSLFLIFGACVTLALGSLYFVKIKGQVLMQSTYCL